MVAEFLVASDSRESDIDPQKVAIAKISGDRELDLDIILPTPRFSSIPVKEILDHNVDRIKELPKRTPPLGLRREEYDGNSGSEIENCRNGGREGTTVRWTRQSDLTLKVN